MNTNELESMLNRLTLREVKERYAKHYGHAPTSKNRIHLIKKILWAHQREQFGDISEATRKKALTIADDRVVRSRFPKEKQPIKQHSDPVILTFKPEPNLLPGSVLTRDYQGQLIRVLVLENGFEWEGQFYKSLSATARAITGTRWNGKLFFGLKKKGNAS